MKEETWEEYCRQIAGSASPTDSYGKFMAAFNAIKDLPETTPYLELREIAFHAAKNAPVLEYEYER